MKRILFIINPISGVGRQKLIEKQTAKILDATKCSYDFVYTQRPRHAEELARNNASDYDIIVGVGGDGTINEIASGLKGSHCQLAIIPTGSGNGLARCLGIPLKISKAIKVIERGIPKKIDTLLCNTICFVNVGGIGFDAEIGHLFADSEKRGFFTYIKITLSEVLTFSPRVYKLAFDGQTKDVEALLISFANSNQWGNDVKIAPQAKLDDGLIDICILKKFPLILSPLIGLRLLFGTITKSRYYESFSVSKLTISEDSPCVKFHLDGEPMIAEGNVLDIEVVPKSLSVIVPK